MLELLSKSTDFFSTGKGRVMVDTAPQPKLQTEQDDANNPYDKTIQEVIDSDSNLSDYFTYWLDKLYSWRENDEQS